jgi:hypothetical protein
VLDNTSRDLLEIHLRLAIVLSKSDWSLIDQLTFKKATRVGEDSKARQLWKFASLHKTKHPTTKTSNSHGSTRHNIPLQRPQIRTAPQDTTSHYKDLKFARLHKTQHPTTKTSNETVINLGGQKLDDGVFLATT